LFVGAAEGRAVASLSCKFSANVIARITRLATRNNRGKIAESEREQLERFLRVGSVARKRHFTNS
jgi:hypothetical protein